MVRCDLWEKWNHNKPVLQVWHQHLAVKYVVDFNRTVPLEEALKSISSFRRWMWFSQVWDIKISDDEAWFSWGRSSQKLFHKRCWLDDKCGSTRTKTFKNQKRRIEPKLNVCLFTDHEGLDWTELTSRYKEEAKICELHQQTESWSAFNLTNTRTSWEILVTDWTLSQPTGRCESADVYLFLINFVKVVFSFGINSIPKQTGVNLWWQVKAEQRLLRPCR